MERRVLPEPLPWLARRDVRERRRVQRLRDAWQKAARRGALQVSEVLRVLQFLSLKVVPALRQAQVAESASLPARCWFQVWQVSSPEVPPAVQEPTPWVPLPQPRALPARSTLRRARREPQAHSVSQPQAQRSLAAPPVRQASARLSQPLPWFLFPLWQPLLLALPLQPLPESSCAPSRRRPRGSSSSASSFP